MRKRVVITGLGCVGPLGNETKTSWEACIAGRSGIAEITKFDHSPFRTHFGGEVKNFEVPAFIPKKDIKKMDAFILYALAATDEALRDANLEITEDLQCDVGSSLGVGIGGLLSIENNHHILENKGPDRISPFFLPMTLPNMSVGNISIFFGAKNYSACTVSACASANHAIGDAARIIERGDAKVMITGGAEAGLTPLGLAGFGAMKALSIRNEEPTRASRPYDKDRDGFVLSEGAGILILEEYEFAKARGARIYCELKGYGFSSDGYHITAPSTEGPARAIKMAIKDAQIQPEQIDYINAHGTSTPTGDINELLAIKMALGETASKQVSISSTKSMHGHLLGAAAGLEGVLTVKALYHNIVPATMNIENLDPECDLDVTPNASRERSIQVAMSNAFGFGGTNATLIFSKL